MLQHRSTIPPKHDAEAQRHEGHGHPEGQREEHGPETAAARGGGIPGHGILVFVFTRLVIFKVAIVIAPGFFTPRSVIQVCSASITTITPTGSSPSYNVRAICCVRRSCTCRRRANTSTIRGILLRPMTFASGR